jgi:hypothetical protein
LRKPFGSGCGSIISQTPDQTWSLPKLFYRSIQLHLQPSKSDQRLSIIVIHIISRFVTVHRPNQLALFFVDAARIEMRVKIAFVTPGFERALEPGDRAAKIAFFNQICADVVVGVAVIGIIFKNTCSEVKSSHKTGKY